MDENQEKFYKCRICGFEKLAKEFRISRRRKKNGIDWRNTRCGACEPCEKESKRIISKRYNERHLEERRKIHREYARNNKEKRKEAAKNFRINNPERYKEIQRKSIPTHGLGRSIILYLILNLNIPLWIVRNLENVGRLKICAH